MGTALSTPEALAAGDHILHRSIRWIVQEDPEVTSSGYVHVKVAHGSLDRVITFRLGDYVEVIG